MLDSDLATLYGVETGALNRQVKRNLDRFPDDFMFQLTRQEVASLICQIGISSYGHGGRRKPAYVFTEQGVAMSTAGGSACGMTFKRVAKSSRMSVNIEIMRAFVRIRQWLASNVELARKLAELEKKYDVQFKIVFDAIRELMRPPDPPRKPIGFQVNE